MIKHLSIVLSLTFFFISCNENRLYNSQIDPKGNLEWNSAEVLIFDIEIIDTTIKYNQLISFRHAIGYPFSACSLKIVEKNPIGDVTEFRMVLKTADENGYIGDCHGDICDLEYPFIKNRLLRLPGTYTYKVTHEMSQDNLQMVMEVGMILDKATN